MRHKSAIYFAVCSGYVSYSSPKNRNFLLRQVFMVGIRVAASWKVKTGSFGDGRMKAKMQQQVQPAEITPPLSAQVRIAKRKVEEEIQNFLEAVDSYPAHVAKDPGISFQQHLGNIVAARKDKRDRHDNSLRRH